MHSESSQQAIETIFVGTWVVLLIGSIVLNQVASPALKQNLQKVVPVVVGLVFLVFVYLLGGSKSLYFAVGPVLLIMFLNVRLVKYCHKCGAMNRSVNWLSAPKYCQKCGQSLSLTPPPHDRA